MKENMGMKVRLWHNLEGKIVLETLRNVTEIHYNYCFRHKFAAGGEIITAFESDIHSTGMTYRLATIAEFEAVLETEIAETF